MIREEHPCSVVDGLLVYKLELSPVSIRLEAAGVPFEDHDSMTIESVTLQDGRVVACQKDVVSGNRNNTFFDTYVNYEDMEIIDVREVKSITVNGKEVKLH